MVAWSLGGITLTVIRAPQIDLSLVVYSCSFLFPASFSKPRGVDIFEVLLIQIQEEMHHFAGLEEGSRGTIIVNKTFVNKLAFPNQIPDQPEKNKGRGGSQGRGKHAIKPLPKTGFGPPHL